MAKQGGHEMDAIENMNLQTVKVHMKKQHRSLMMRRPL